MKTLSIKWCYNNYTEIPLSEIDWLIFLIKPKLLIFFSITFLIEVKYLISLKSSPSMIPINIHKPAVMLPTVSNPILTWLFDTRWTKARKIYFPGDLELLFEALALVSLADLLSDILETLESLESLFDEVSLISEVEAPVEAELFFP